MSEWIIPTLISAVGTLIAFAIWSWIQQPRLTVRIPHPPTPGREESVDIGIEAHHADIEITALVLDVEKQDAEMLHPILIGIDEVDYPILIQEGTTKTITAGLTIARRNLNLPEGENRVRVVVRADRHDIEKRSDPFWI